MINRIHHPIFIALFLYAALFSPMSFALQGENPFAGVWRFTLNELSNTCGEGVERTFFETRIEQSNNIIKLTDFNDKTHVGPPSGNTFNFSSSQPDDGGTLDETVSLTLSDDETQISGNNQWLWYNSAGSCNGQVDITAIKLKSIIQITIQTPEGEPISGTDVTFSETSTTQNTIQFTIQSDTNGQIINPFDLNWTGRITLAKQGYNFVPNAFDLHQLSRNESRSIIATAVESEAEARAIIIAGGGNFDDPLWTATNNTTNFAYRTLLYKGIRKDNIRYYNFQTDQDVDNDGLNNDIITAPNSQNLQQSINDWAQNYVTDKKPLILFLVDHGLTDTFFITKPAQSQAETINSATLDSWLDELQTATQSKVIVIYDACFSGSFMQGLKATSGQQRILIFSADYDELAYFGARGDLSFSSFFWTHNLKGKNLKEAFQSARIAIKSATNNVQNPQLDDNGDGIWDAYADGNLASLSYLGNPFISAAALPQITSNSGNAILQDQTTHSISATIDLASSQIAKVWAIVVAPTVAQGTVAVINLPEFELHYDVATNSYKTTLSNLNQNGIYQVVIYAQANDQSQFISQPSALKLAISQSQSLGSQVRLEGDSFLLDLNNISFQGKNYQLILESHPSANGLLFTVVNDSLSLVNNNEAVSAILSEINFDLHIPALAFENSHWNVKLKFIPANEPTWQVEFIEKNG
jgi:hypothetical protein